MIFKEEGDFSHKNTYPCRFLSDIRYKNDNYIVKIYLAYSVTCYHLGFYYGFYDGSPQEETKSS